MYDHVVLISIDTLRSDAIAANPLKLWPEKYPGVAAPRTAILDQLIGKGFFFANCLSAAPYTSASHASLLTGKWPLRHGVYEFYNRKLQYETLMTRAKRSGYTTVLKSDFPVILGPTLGFDRGVDHFIVEDDARCLELIGASERSFSLVHFGGVHVPYGFHNLSYGGQAYRAKVEQLEAELGRAVELPKDQLFETYRDQEDLHYLMRYKRIIQELWHAGRGQDIFALYLEGIEHFLTTRFERFIERLSALLQHKNVLLVLFGDHGEEYDADSFGHFNSVAEGVIRVPLLFIARDIEPGMHLDRVRTVDAFATIEALSRPGARSRFSTDGTSLAGLMQRRETLPALTNFAQTYVADTSGFIRFQRNVMAKGRKHGSLPHLLYKEAVWEGNHRLTRYVAEFSEYLGGLHAIEPICKLEVFDPGQVPRACADAALQSRLVGSLDAYNASHSPQRKRA
ncbi:sulfatase-like protein [Tahibacter aquaticus]|uniref:Sulfatase-like protein n=1 Tax=Tahibacter aquaticus TaxID=520092 RepID=A0A4R6Z6W4_9GAMM|nr:sulfatase-like hydrolase/transferase [Tahibacter aquaticus]TDR47495.1 sulfatase-like protein [Tahibacter aquaticus]